MASRGVMLIGTLSACFSPSYNDCAVSCASGKGCPSGLSCVADVCRIADYTGSCPLLVDASPDSETCDLTAWNYTPLNVQGCAYQTGTFAWTPTGPIEIDTSTGTILSASAAPPSTMVAGT